MMQGVGLSISIVNKDNPLDLLEQFGVDVTVPRDEEVYGHGDTPEYCWRVAKGCLRTVRVMEDGRRHVSEFLLPGDFLGLDDPNITQFAAEAVTFTTLRRYPYASVQALAARCPALRRQIVAITVQNLHNAYDRMLLLGRKTAKERIASFVLEMDRRIANAGKRMLELPMSRGDIADYLGLTQETVCRGLAQMTLEGTLMLSRNSIELRDRPSLHTQAGNKTVGERLLEAA